MKSDEILDLYKLTALHNNTSFSCRKIMDSGEFDELLQAQSLYFTSLKLGHGHH